MFHNNVITKKMLYSLGDQSMFIFPAKNARGRKDRDYHGDRCVHTIFERFWYHINNWVVSSLQNEQFLYFLSTV